MRLRACSVEQVAIWAKRGRRTVPASWSGESRSSVESFEDVQWCGISLQPDDRAHAGEVDGEAMDLGEDLAQAASTTAAKSPDRGAQRDAWPCSAYSMDPTDKWTSRWLNG